MQNCADYVVDIHTHTFPEKIAKHALDILSEQCNTIYYRDGNVQSLIDSMKTSGVDRSIILPVATKPGQTETINRTAIEVNEKYYDQGIMSLGGIHPDNENYKEILDSLKSNGIKGIKLHPVYQGHFFDEICNMRIVDYANNLGLVVIIHAGYDIGFPGNSNATVEHILPVIKQLKPDKLILAHMGGWGDWDAVEEAMETVPLKIDTAFSFTPLRHKNAETGEITLLNAPAISMERFVRMVRKCGEENVYFGTDSPWSDQKEALDMVKKSGLTDEELKLVLGENSRKLFGI